ncbi:MAG: ABC transporter permease, partial [Deltaproteobacteria bacterium]|nr:ABC transporter permease [Deltaproteobacteria bacterium]
MKINASTVLFYLSILFLVVLGTAAMAAPKIAPYDPVEQNLDERFSPPGRSHLLGTDNLGRDVFSRIIFGSRSALLVG